MARRGSSGRRSPDQLAPITFLPSSLPGLYAWYDASQTLDQSGGTISSLKDLSGNGRHTTSGTATLTPQHSGYKGRAVITMDGATQWLRIAASTTFNIGAVFNAFTVYDCPGSPDVIYTIFDSNDGAARTPMIQNDGGTLSFGVVSEISYAASPSYPANISNLESNGASSIAWLNGVQSATGTVSSTGLNGLTIGGGSGASPVDLLNGNIAEIIFYNRTMTTEERGLVNKYLSNKYKITLS